MTSVASWLHAARARLAARASASDPAEDALDVELLLGHASGRSRAALRARPEATLDAPTLAALDALLARRLDGEPLAHILGTREFWSLELAAGPAALVPRPDTETLVERALARLTDAPPGPLLDAGTGGGAIAIALAVELGARGDASRAPASVSRTLPATAAPSAGAERAVIASERSAAALELARRNVARLAPGRVALVRASWLDAFAEESLALIVSNPPYLAEDDPHLPALAHEPREALVAGPGGLEAIAHLTDAARRTLRPGGALLLEHGHEQGAAVRALYRRHGWRDVATVTDLAGRERVSEGRRPA